MRDALAEAEAADDLFIEGQYFGPQAFIRCRREDAAFCRKGIRNIEIKGVADAECVVFVVENERFDDEFPPCGKLFDDDLAAVGPAGSFGELFTDLLLA